jgi:hypothetical protein
VTVVVGIAAAIVAGAFGHVTKRIEKPKLTAETTNLQAQVVEREQKARDAYSAATKNIAALAVELRDLLLSQASRAAVTQPREKLCCELLDCAIPAFHNWVEFRRVNLAATDPKLLLKFASENVVFELRRFTEWLRILNNPALLEAIGQHPARISKFTLHPIDELADELIGPGAGEAAILLRGAVNEVVEAGAQT